MSENREILTLISFSLIIGISALALLSYLPNLYKEDAEVETYNAILYPNGTLVEEYEYTLRSRGNRFLFRVWDDPLTKNNIGVPYIEPLEIIPVENAISYYKDFYGKVSVDETYQVDRNLIEPIISLAEKNEVGSFQPESYLPGKYNVKFVFLLHPNIEYDENNAHLNLKLANQHIPYKEVEITFKDAGYIEKIYPHPPSLKVRNLSGEIIVKGSSRENELLEVEILMNPKAKENIEGFPIEVTNVRTKTVNVNNIITNQYYSALLLYHSSRILVLLIPLLLYIVYYKYGREKEYTIPRYLATIPNKDRKPWIVNQLFEDTALDYDDDGFYATILHLHMGKKIDIATKNGGLRIEILNKNVEDRYEKKVLDFLETISEDNVVDSTQIEELTKRIREGTPEQLSKAQKIKEQLIELTTYINKNVARDFIIDGRRKILPLIAIPSILILISFYLLLSMTFESELVISSLLFLLISLFQSASALLFPPTLFGKWKGETYKEKLEWDAFARHLDNFSRIKDYAPDDISIWGDWLVYGTALGVGDNVSRAMRDLNIDLPEREFISLMPIYFHPLVVASAPSKGRVAGGIAGGGGSFGAGGGFGGGGAGVR